MVVIGLHVNWSVLNVCVSKCKPYLWCVVLGGWVARYHIDTYACCHVAKRPKLVIKTGGSTQLDWRARRFPQFG